MTDDHELEPPVEGSERLPRSIEPPRDLWPAIEARLAPRAARARRQPRRWLRPVLALAAAVALVVASSATTAWWLRTHGMPGAPGGPGGAPAPVLAAEAGYLRTADELGRVLEARRAQLAPETVATLERSLALIDQAIAESRAALAADPRDQDLAALLEASYARKVALLRRALDLPLRS